MAHTYSSMSYETPATQYFQKDMSTYFLLENIPLYQCEKLLKRHLATCCLQCSVLFSASMLFNTESCAFTFYLHYHKTHDTQQNQLRSQHPLLLTFVYATNKDTTGGASEFRLPVRMQPGKRPMGEIGSLEPPCWLVPRTTQCESP